MGDMEEELRLLRAERQRGNEITRHHGTGIIDHRDNEETTEVRRPERKGKLIFTSSETRRAY